MNPTYLFVCLMVVVVASATEHTFVDELLTASEQESYLTEDLARLLKIDYERQGACGSEVSSTCCASCAYDGNCYNGGFCCELNKVKTKMLKSGETTCPRSWSSECKLSKLLPIKSCSLGSRKDAYSKHQFENLDEESDSGSDSGSDDDRLLERSGVRLMCLCLSSRRCCSAPPATTPTTTATPPTSVVYTTTWGWPYYYDPAPAGRK